MCFVSGSLSHAQEELLELTFKCRRGQHTAPWFFLGYQDQAQLSRQYMCISFLLFRFRVRAWTLPSPHLSSPPFPVASARCSQA